MTSTSRYFILPACLICLGIFPALASAASCRHTSGGNYAVATGHRNIPRDAGTTTIVIPKIRTEVGGYHMSCPGDKHQDRDAYITFSVSEAPVPGYTDVYPTNIKGLGVKYHFAGNSGLACDIPFDQTIPNSSYTITCHILHDTTLSWSWGTSVEFVKTGLIQAGELKSMPAVTMSYRLNNQEGTWSLPAMYTGALSGTLALAACVTRDVQDGSSTARGVALQLLGNDDKPFPLGTLRRFDDHRPDIAYSYGIPLKARYYRIGGVSGGTANTSMIFTIQYL